MTEKLYHKILVLVVAVLFSVTSPSPGYAFSWEDLLSFSSAMDNSSQTSPSGSFKSLLSQLLNGNVLETLANIRSTISNGTAIPAKSRNSKEVIGFYAEWWGNDTSSFNSLSKNVNSIDTIAPFWATVQADGTVTNRGGNDHNAVVSYAHQHNVSVLLLVNNEKEGQGAVPIHTVLSNKALRSKTIDNLENYLKTYGLDGINIDFEMVPAEDRDNLTAFMKEVSERLKPQGYVVSISAFPKQNEENDVTIAYDYEKLANYADKIMLMMYDNHGAWSTAGPIADIQWAENNLKYALKFIPKQKIYLGVAGYGYDWSKKGVESVEYDPVVKLIQKYGASVQWDDTAKSPHFSYTESDGSVHQVWFENSQSLTYKLNLVTKYDIAGIALWKLGGEDPSYWPLVNKTLRK